MILLGISHPPEKKLKVQLFSRIPGYPPGRLTNRHGKYSFFLGNTIKILDLPASYVSLPSRERSHISPNGKLGKASTQECRLGWDMLVPRKVPQCVCITFTSGLCFGILSFLTAFWLPLCARALLRALSKETPGQKLKEGRKFNPTTGLNNFYIHTLICI